MPTFAVRGATTADENSERAIFEATRDLLAELSAANQLEPGDIISAFFTMTPDLDAAFPARTARQLGWTQVALLDAQQPVVKGDLERCIRVLVHFNRSDSLPAHHIYLKGARSLRPDLLSE